LVFCTRTFQALVSLTSWLQFLMFLSYFLRTTSMSSHLRLGLPRVRFLQVFPNQNCVCILPFPHTCHMPRSSRSS
jgi:hypothetical protein